MRACFRSSHRFLLPVLIASGSLGSTLPSCSRETPGGEAIAVRETVRDTLQWARGQAASVPENIGLTPGAEQALVLATAAKGQ